MEGQQAARQQALDQAERQALDNAEQQTLRLQQQRREANEKIAAVLAANQNALEQNLLSIKRMQTALDAPSTGTSSSPVASMTSGQLQMLQGLVMANSTDGSGNDANSSAALNALQQMGNQDNLNQQTRDTPNPDLVPDSIVNKLGERCRPSLSIIFARWVSTVLMVIPNLAAISLFAFPSARSRIISTSRGFGRAGECSVGSD